MGPWLGLQMWFVLSHYVCFNIVRRIRLFNVLVCSVVSLEWKCVLASILARPAFSRTLPLLGWDLEV